MTFHRFELKRVLCKSVVLTVVALSLSSCSFLSHRENSTAIANPPTYSSSWTRTQKLSADSREYFFSGHLKWVLRATGDRSAVCWAATLSSGSPELQQVMAAYYESCSELLNKNAEYLQFTFAQSSAAAFAQENGSQVIAGVADDRLDRVTFVSKSGKKVTADIAEDGTYLVGLPLTFQVQSVEFSGSDMRVVCPGGAVDELGHGHCKGHLE